MIPQFIRRMVCRHDYEWQAQTKYGMQIASAARFKIEYDINVWKDAERICTKCGKRK